MFRLCHEVMNHAKHEDMNLHSDEIFGQWQWRTQLDDANKLAIPFNFASHMTGVHKYWAAGRLLFVGPPYRS